MIVETLFNWLHLVAVTVWIGGLVFLLAVMRGNPPALLEAAMRFRPWVWAAMTVVALSGVYRIVALGGMKALPVVLHIKITLALIMILLTLTATLRLLPKAVAQPEQSPGAFLGVNLVVVALGLAIFWMLQASGII